MMYLWPGCRDLDGFSNDFGVFVSIGKGISASVKNGTRLWAVDNGAYTSSFNTSKFFSSLQRLIPYQDTCLFVTIPDVLGNAIATMSKWRSYDYAYRVHDMGFPIAFVAQDGQELFDFPPEFDWLFVGGTTKWKLSDDADQCIYRAMRLGKKIHVGRVNSLKRIHHFRMMGVDTCDGTSPIYSPDVCKKKYTGILRQQVFSLFALSGSNSSS